jgi:putative phage-type endonuclease
MKHQEHVDYFNKLADNSNCQHDKWLYKRKNGIGASDVGSILGVNKYRNQVDVYLEKTTDKLDKHDNEKMKIGRLMESSVLLMFEKETGLSASLYEHSEKHSKYPFLYATPDALLSDFSAGIEIKTGMDGDHWDDVPEQYYAQCQLSMEIFGVNTWHLYAILAGFNGFKRKHFVIKRNDLYIKSLIKICYDFWNNNVLARVAPVAKSIDDINKLFTDSQEIRMTATDEVKKLINEYKKVKVQMYEVEKILKPLQIKEKQIKEKLALSMEDAEIATNENDEEILNYKIVNRSSLDTKRLKNDLPNIYDEYVKKTTYRKLTIKD